jgi:Flp pilus assembly protein TadG
MLGCFETFSLINSKLKVQRIAREGAREAAINYNGNGLNLAKAKAKDIADQYLPNTNPDITVYINKVNGEDANVVCSVSLDYKYVQFLKKEGMGGKKINATAIYPWEDQT